MSVILSHPTGNANVRATAFGLYKAGLLSQFNTTIATFEGDFLDRIALGTFSELRRRQYDKRLKHITQQSPLLELGRLVAQKMGFSFLTQHETGVLSIDKIYKNLDRCVSRKLKSASISGIDSIYAYEDGAFLSFVSAKENNLRCIYDLPIGYWRAYSRLLENEKVIRPQWTPTIPGFKDSSDKLIRKDKELELADLIFVASSFTAETLKDYPGILAPVHVIPYGFPKVSYSKKYNYDGKRPLKLLFVGSLSQRKGIAQLFEAVQELRDFVELTLIGAKTGSHCQILDYELEKHHWIESLPHSSVLALMRVHDVLVFPSLFEGFGLVISEAMSQGTPVITTERTAGPDIIKNGSNGWIVEAGSSIALKSTIENLIENPELIEINGLAAMEAARRRPWEVYSQEIAQAIINHKKI